MNKLEAHHKIEIFCCVEDGTYVAIVTDLPHCSAWGETHEEALAQAQDAIRGHIKDRQEYGDPIPEPVPWHRTAAR